jgi:hypothetical protein
MLATIVDTKALGEAAVASLIAGIGITAAFAIFIFGVTRTADMLRADRRVLATATGALAALALAIVTASIVLGIVAMTSK